MTDMFAERERAFEQKWAHDQDLRFKVVAHRNRLLGRWVAGEIGLKGAAAEGYAKAIVLSEVIKDGDESVIQKILADFKAAKISRTEHLVRRKMDEFFRAARAKVMKED